MTNLPVSGGRPASRPLFRPAVAASLAAVAVALLIHTFDDRYSSGMFATAPNAMVLPRGLLILWAGLAIATLVADLRRPTASGRDGISTALWLCVILLASAAALPAIGFAATVTPLVPAALVAMGERRVLVLLLATTLLGPGLWLLFHHVLLIRLPSILPGGLM